MKSAAGFPKLEFATQMDEREWFEAEQKGYLSHARVRMADGAAYPVMFYEPGRLAQDLEYETSTGRMCIAEPSLIVLTCGNAGKYGERYRSAVRRGLLRFTQAGLRAARLIAP